MSLKKPQTRSSSDVWLLGKSESTIAGAGLPTKNQVLRKFMYHHLDEKQVQNRSAELTVEAVVPFWVKANVPMTDIRYAAKKLLKLYEEYKNLKKNRTKEFPSYRMKEDIFRGELNDVFDLSRKDALHLMKNEEDKSFLVAQLEDRSSSSFGGVDKKLADQQKRKRMRCDAEKVRQEKAKSQIVKTIDTGELSETSFCSSGTSDSSDEDVEFKGASSSQKPLIPSKRPKTVFNRDLSLALDRANISDRRATLVVSAVAQSLGHSLDEIAVSRSTTRRMRRSTRETTCIEDQARFSTDGPLILHWDGKLLPKIVQGVEKVDRIAILVTDPSNGEEKLLGVPMVATGTGVAQANACLKLVDDWSLRSKIRGIVFDTTASNTGLQSGACALIEKSLDIDLIWIACRHHVLEVVLSAVFNASFVASSGPEVGLFKRFQQNWGSLDSNMFESAPDCIFPEGTAGLRNELLVYYKEAVMKKNQRDDYDELMLLCLLFLGGRPEDPVSTRSPGGMHHARWMAKAIYTIKIFLFRSQVSLTKREKKGLEELSLFVALIYGRYWNEANLAHKAPLNDLNFLRQLETYENNKLKNAALAAMKRHLWYLSEYLIPLALFDPRVSNSTKQLMVNNMIVVPEKKKGLKRLDGKNFTSEAQLESYATKRSTIFFNLLLNDGEEKAKCFMQKDPSSWMTDEVFQEMNTRVQNMAVVNDCAEKSSCSYSRIQPLHDQRRGPKTISSACCCPSP